MKQTDATMDVAELTVDIAKLTRAAAGDGGEPLSLVTAPHPVLARPAEPVDPTDPKAVGLVADLLATMRTAPGCVGLAAPQVGMGVQMFAVDVTGHPQAVTTHGAFVLCNATVVSATRRRPGREGCMSVPDLTADIRRATRVVVTGALPGSGEVVTVTTDAFEARALQHELDHCDGLLFLDRVTGAHAVHRRQVYQ